MIVGALAGLLVAALLLFLSVCVACSQGDLTAWGKFVGVTAFTTAFVTAGALIGLSF